MADKQYIAKVEEGDLSMNNLEDELNDRYRDGYRLHSIFVENKNTIMIFERLTAQQ